MPSNLSRRAVLTTLGAVGLAGCSARPNEPPPSGTDERPDPDRHVFGADGEWSSVGCNASNTREVADGKAPVDGVAETWRVEVPQLAYQEPIVAGGRVYQVTQELEVFDATDGTALWTNADADTPPLVRDDTAFVGAGTRLLALDAKTGESKWERTLTEEASVRSPAMYGSDWLYVPAGETIYRVNAETGDVDWSRRLFGRALGSPPIYSGLFVAVATEAGKLYLLDDEGTGWGEWTLPSTPQAPPTADTDRVYCNCLDGRTYAVDLGQESRGDVDWSVETGWANGGLAINERLYAASANGLHAIDPATGERVWTYDTGDWQWTAPALGRDTLFVGGDKLYALDPSPIGLLEEGPATRFEKSFAGRVGPGPVLDDGVLYTIAQTGESSFHLLALE